LKYGVSSMQKLFSLKGIRGKLLLLLLIVLLPALLIEAFVFYRWFEARKSVELQANLEVARAVGRTFDAFLQGLIHNELTVGLALTASHPMTDEDRDRMLDTFKADNPAVRSIFWMNPEGIVLASSLRSYIGFNFSDRSYFQKVKKVHDWAVSELILGRVTGKPAFTVSRAMRNDDGELLGVVAASIEPGHLERVLGVIRSGDAGLSLIDNKGMRVCRYPPIEYTWEQRNWLKRYPVLEDSLKGKEVLTTVISQLTGKRRLAAFTPISSIGWVAAAGRAEDQVIKPITSAVLFQAGLVLLVTLMGFGAAVAFARPISSTIIGLRKYALALGRGERESVAPVSGPKELKDLAIEFNLMAGQVHSREAALRESEQRWATTLASIGDAVIATDVEARVTFMNPVAERLTGWTLSEASQKPVTEVFNIINEYTRKAADNPVARVLREGTVVGLANHTVLICKDGTEVAIDDSGAPIRDGSGKISGVILVFRDITERKQAEKALLDAHERAVWLGRFPEENPNPVLRVSADGIVLYCNPATAKIHGWECGVGRLLQKELLPLVGQAVGEEREVQQDIELGGRIYIVWIAPFREEGYVNVYGRDITARKWAESERERLLAEVRAEKEKLRKSRDELDLRVRERTAELERKNKELQDFAFVASHDLQEPLRKVRTFGDMLLAKSGGFLDESSRDYLKRMQTAVTRMQNLLKSLLAYSRVTTKTEPPKKIDLRKCVEEALSNLEIVIKDKNARVEVGDLPTIRADRVQMVQLFQNLIGNSLKFSRDGHTPHVKVYARQVGGANGACEICVEDNGIGFDEKYVDKIFLPFHRLHGKSSEYDGIGMGLAICMKIAERHAGEITARSELGKGSTFILTVPVETKMT
jgi:PAS domain S-box-containing protein